MRHLNDEIAKSLKAAKQFYSQRTHLINAYDQYVKDIKNKDPNDILRLTHELLKQVIDDFKNPIDLISQYNKFN